MTLPELLDHLLKNAIYECEEKHRKLILSLNGLAGLFTIKEDYKSACEMYKKVLSSIEEHKINIRTDTLQQIHTFYNYSELILLWMNKSNESSEIKQVLGSDDPKTISEDMRRKSKEFCESYLEKFQSVTQNCKDILNRIYNVISEIKLNFKCKMLSSATSSWWIKILQSMGEEEKIAFIEKIKDSLMNAPGISFMPGATSISNSFNDSSGLSYRLVTLSDDLHETRSSLIDAIKSITTTPTSNILNSAIQCHLRPTPGYKAPKCSFCTTDDIFCQYENKLFKFKDVEKSRKFDNDSDSSDTEFICFKQRRQGTHADSEFELILKMFVSYSRIHKDLSLYNEDGNNELKLFDSMKKEFKLLRNTWMKMCEYVSTIDELEMAKTSMRLLLPDENPPKPPVPYIILPHEVQLNMLQLQSDVICHQAQLKKKLGQLFYLQNLKKVENTCNELFCPVCRITLEETWSVLQCGHSFCHNCVNGLKREYNRISRHFIKCPICREDIPTEGIYCIQCHKNFYEDDFPIKGSYSAKIYSVVKCLLNIKKKDSGAKCLVFSSWSEFLSILEQALDENEVSYLSLSNRKKFQVNLDNFKHSSTDNVLLLPLSVGANGLNIIEATHVLLLEPVLDNSKVRQAIGRVHRIGQTKETVVHKFVIDGTIEENINTIHQIDLSPVVGSSEDLTSAMTVKDILHFFGEE